MSKQIMQRFRKHTPDFFFKILHLIAYQPKGREDESNSYICYRLPVSAPLFPVRAPPFPVCASSCPKQHKSQLRQFFQFDFNDDLFAEKLDRDVPYKVEDNND